MGGTSSVHHIGVIMDGNRRWAKQQGQTKFFGYEKGFEKFIQLLEWCLDFNISFLTVYTFSTENFKREKEDFKYIYGLILGFFRKGVNFCSNNKIVFKFIGRRELIGDDLSNGLERINKQTIQPNLSVQIAFGYGGRDELLRVMRLIAADAIAGKIVSADITEQSVEKYFDTQGIPDVDMVIRTGKANRLSNFLLWQSHYAEIYFLETMWPAFSREEFESLVNICKDNKKADYGK